MLKLGLALNRDKPQISALAPYSTNLYGTPDGAFSLRKLSPTNVYNGPAIRVRRSSDNAEQDINFLTTTENSDIDQVALLAFVLVGNGFVTTWYNQNGTANHFTQSSAVLQPQIVVLGNILLLSGKPTIYQTASAYFQQDSFINKTLNIFMVTEKSTATTYVKFTGVALNGTGFDYVSSSGSGDTTIYQNYGTPTLYVNKILFTGTTRGNVYTALNGNKIETQINASTVLFTFFRFGWYASASIGYEGNCSELIIFNTPITTTRNDIIDNENSYYAIF